MLKRFLMAWFIFWVSVFCAGAIFLFTGSIDTTPHPKTTEDLMLGGVAVMVCLIYAETVLAKYLK
jgi:hypothetical protein